MRAISFVTPVLWSVAPVAVPAPELEIDSNRIVVEATGEPGRLTSANLPSLEWGSDSPGADVSPLCPPDSFIGRVFRTDVIISQRKWNSNGCPQSPSRL